MTETTLRTKLAIGGALAAMVLHGCSSPFGSAPAAVAPVMRVTAEASPGQVAYERGKRLLSEGRHAMAIASFREALVLEPSHVDALIGLGVAWSTAGRLDQAAHAFETVLRRNSQDAIALGNLGYLRATQGQHDEALRLLEQALRIEPANTRLRTNLVELRQKAAAAGAAQSAQQPAVEAHRDPAVGTGLKTARNAQVATVEVAPGIFEMRRQPLASGQASPLPAAAIVATAPGIVSLRASSATAGSVTREKAMRAELQSSAAMAGAAGGSAESFRKSVERTPRPDRRDGTLPRSRQASDTVLAMFLAAEIGAVGTRAETPMVVALALR